mmetsp:Transcript_15317/g.40473  ORF Transcript_15317/g.40473 Transcript_15317/m.40473 type:complete len:99 (-) Transcript_15317:189-485(-)
MTHRRRRSLAPIFIARHHIISLNSTFQPLPADDGSGDVFVHQTRIHKDGFRSLAEGEPLEFKVVEDGGKAQAVDVTGPDGAYVKGAPPPVDEHNDYSW